MMRKTRNESGEKGMVNVLLSIGVIMYCGGRADGTEFGAAGLVIDTKSTKNGH